MGLTPAITVLALDSGPLSVFKAVRIFFGAALRL
jgi:hypothetical protein